MDIKVMVHHHPGFADSLWIYRNGTLSSSMNIDRTYDALYWMKRFEMTKCETVISESGEKFDIYKNDEFHRLCAVPIA